MNKRSIGKKYEELATQYLLNNNFKILAKNFNTKIGEIDIVAKDDEYLCFIEVKFRNSADFGRAIEAVDEYKQKKIINTSKIYLYQNNISFDSKIRYDVICFDKENITYIKNAFGA